MNKIVSSRLILDPVDVKTGNKILSRNKSCNTGHDYIPSDALRIYLPFYLEKLESDRNWLGYGPWLIMDKEYQSIVGEIGFFNRKLTTTVLEIGYQIIPCQRKKGYATEAVSLLCQWAFSRNTKKITACCDIHNIISHQVLYKNGFKVEEVDRGCKYFFMTRKDSYN